MGLQPGIAGVIGRAVLMLAAVQFYHQARFQADEIQDVTAIGMLAAELESLQALAAQVMPEGSFGIGPLEIAPTTRSRRSIDNGLPI